MCRKSSTLFLFAIFIFALILLSALMPLSCFDQDGHLGSFVTEGFILCPIFCSVVGLFTLLMRLPVTYLADPQSVSTLIILPPIPAQIN